MLSSVLGGLKVIQPLRSASLYRLAKVTEQRSSWMLAK